MRHRSTKRFTNLPCAHRNHLADGHCRFVHGYSRSFKFYFEATHLDARGFVVDYPVLLLDEPTAALDADNRRTVVALIHEAKARGTAMLGIFHDAEVRDQVADRLFAMRPPSMAA